MTAYVVGPIDRLAALRSERLTVFAIVYAALCAAVWAIGLSILMARRSRAYRAGLLAAKEQAEAAAERNPNFWR